MRLMRLKTIEIVSLVVVTLVASSSALAQTPGASDQAARLRAVLPADVAQRILARIAAARAQQLPAEALENRALKFAAKGVDPADIERSVNEQATRMESARAAIVNGRRANAAGDEIEAGAEAMRKGVDGNAVALLAKNAPSGRSLAVPLFVIGSLTDRGLSSDAALQSVLAKLRSRATDAELESMPGDLPSASAPGQVKKDGQTGREFGQSHRPPSAGRPATAGPPAGVPGNAGTKSRPAQSHKPPTKKTSR